MTERSKSVLKWGPTNALPPTPQAALEELTKLAVRSGRRKARERAAAKKK
jgi:hypothetical protein